MSRIMPTPSLPSLALGALLVSCTAGGTSSAECASVLELDAGARVGAEASPARADQATWLQYIREEEKLLRDVYWQLSDRPETKLFPGMSTLEDQAFEAIGEVMARHQVSDPDLCLDHGIFASPALQELYTQRLADGKRSTRAALRVGARSEEEALVDLQRASTEAVDADVRELFENVALGSRNHLREFVQRLAGYGERYTPVYLDEPTFQKIVNSQFEPQPEL